MLAAATPSQVLCNHPLAVVASLLAKGFFDVFFKLSLLIGVGLLLGYWWRRGHRAMVRGLWVMSCAVRLLRLARLLRRSLVRAVLGGLGPFANVLVGAYWAPC